MAVTWTPIVNGYNLLLLRGDFNTFNSAVSVNIDSIEADVSNLGSGKISISDTGILFSSLSTPMVNPLTTAYSKVAMVNTVSIDSAKGHMSHDTVLNTWTINTNGIYKLVFDGSISANNGSIVTFNFNINGSSAIAIPPEFVGRGSNPVAISNHTTISLTAGTTLYIEAKADSSISMTAGSCGFTVEKTHH